MPTDVKSLYCRENKHIVVMAKWDMENDGNYNNKIVFVF